jgi:hypothetical protein
MKVKHILLAAALLLLTISSTSSNHPKKIIKPLTYCLKKASIKKLVARFDSISENKTLYLGLSDEKQVIHIGTTQNGRYSSVLLDLANDSSAFWLKNKGFTYSDILSIKKLLEHTNTKSIKTVYHQNVKTVELIISQNFFSDNCRGLIFLENKPDANILPAYYRKMTDSILYYRHLSYE